MFDNIYTYIFMLWRFCLICMVLWNQVRCRTFTHINTVITSLCPSIDDSVPAEREPGEVVDSLVGKQVEYAKEDGGKRTGMVIHQVEAKPSVYFIKFDDDFLIYVYDLVKTS